MVVRFKRKPDEQYWVNARQWNQNELDAAAKDIAGMAYASSDCSREKCNKIREFILNISMTYLADVRGNYYWPELYREISKRVSDSHNFPSEGELATFCRKVLLRTDDSELSYLQNSLVHNRFIALIFEQAGIGKDRNKIIRQYLEWLVNNRMSIAMDGPGKWADIAVEKYIETQTADIQRDVNLLANVLARIGSELLALVDAIESHPDRVEMIEWSWEKLSQWWMGKTGFDLDALTPSAANVLREWISRLSVVWTKSEIFRLSRMGVISCEWPDGSNCSSFNHHTELPLGNAVLVRGESRQNIVVVDSENMSRADIVKNEPAGKSRALYVSVRFKWRFGKLFLVLGRVKSNVEDGDGYSLTLAGKEIWQGAIGGSYILDTKRRYLNVGELNLTHGNMVEVELYRNNELIEKQTIEVWPLSNSAFLVSGSNVCRPFETNIRYVETGVAAGALSLVVSQKSPEVFLVNLTEVCRRESDFTGVTITEISLGVDSAKSASVKFGGLSWFIDFRPIIRLCYLPDSEHVSNGVSFVGAGNVRIIGAPSDVLISISDKVDNSVFDSDAGLWITFDGLKCFSRLDRSAVTNGEAGSIINISQLAKKQGILPGSGVLEVEPGTSDSVSGKCYRFFIISSVATVKTSAIDRFSSVAFDDYNVHSNRDVSVVDLRESRYCHGVIPGEDWQVALRWKPLILDLMINAVAGSGCDYRYKLFAGVEQNIPSELDVTPFFPSDVEGILDFQGEKYSSVSGADCSFLAAVLSGMFSRGSPKGILSLECGGEQVSWTIDASAVIAGSSVDLISHVGDIVQIAVNLQVMSLIPTEIKVSLCYGERELAVTPEWTHPNSSLLVAESFKFSYCLDHYSGNDSNIHVNVYSDEKIIYSISEKISTDPQCNGSDKDYRLDIKNLIRAYRDTGSYTVLEAVFFQYLEAVVNNNGLQNSSAISGAIGAGVYPDVENALMISMKLIDAAISGSTTVIRLPSLDILPSDMALMLASMWLMLSGRFASRGVLVPEEFHDALKMVGSCSSRQQENKRIYQISYFSHCYACGVANDFGIDVLDNAICSSNDRKIDFNSDLAVVLRRVCSEFDFYVGKLNG
jgi:hypothetical protein